MNNLCARFLRCSIANSQYSSCVALGRNLSYRSDLSLDVLYPNSNAQIFTPPSPPKHESGKFNGFIPINQLKITYSRSSGPGGQNVNCVDTKVDLRFKVDAVDFISEATKKLLLSEHKSQITKDGFFVIRNDVTRYQQLNLADALEKLRNLIRALETPKTKEVSAETVEKHRRKHEKAARERIFVKRHRSAVKADRQNNSVDF